MKWIGMFYNFSPFTVFENHAKSLIQSWLKTKPKQTQNWVKFDLKLKQIRFKSESKLSQNHDSENSNVEFFGDFWALCSFGNWWHGEKTVISPYYILSKHMDSCVSVWNFMWPQPSSFIWPRLLIEKEARRRWRNFIMSVG